MAVVDNQVVYSVTLKDMLTSGLKGADGAAKQLEGTMGKIKSALGVLGVGFAVFKGVEFVKESIEKFHHLEQATAQVRAGLESTGHAAGMSFKDVEDSAKGLSKGMLYGKTAILEMQSVLLTFPAVTKEAFTPASQIIADMSTRLGTDLKGSAIQVGKALQDPIKGVSALRRVGVNFSEAQTEMIKKMVAGGQTAKAQALILKELQTEFGGSAKAAFEADPMGAFNKRMGSFSMAVGQAGEELLQVLAPALMVISDAFVSAGEGIKAAIEWLKENKETIKDVAMAIGIAGLAWGAYSLIVNASAIATGVATVATNALSAAMFVLENVATFGIPIAIAAVTAAIAFCWLHFVKFRAIIMGTWGVIKEFGSIVGDVFTGVAKMIGGVMSVNPKMVAEGYAQAAGAMKDAGTKMGKAYQEGYQGVMSDYAKDQATKGKDKVVAKAVKGATGADGAVATKDTSPKKASGTKSVNITISINKLIETFKISTVNIQESGAKIQEMVANTLLQAINDSSIQAGV